MNIFFFSFIGALILVLLFLLFIRKKSLKKAWDIWNETFDSISDSIAILDEEGHILKANAAMKRMFGSDIESKPCYKVIHKTEYHMQGCPLLRSKNTGVREEMILSFNDKVYSVSVDPIFVSKTKKKYFIHIIKDVTLFKQIQKEMEEEKRKYETLVNNLPGFVYRCANDKNWTMQFISDGCFAVTGYTPEEFIGNKVIAFNEIIDSKYQDYLWKKWQNVLRNKETFEDEYEIITKSGERKWVWERGQGVFDENGNLLFLEGFITDITNKTLLFNALQESEEKFKALTNSTTASIFIYQGEKFVYVNPATEALTEYTQEELLNKRFWDLVHPDYQELVKERGLQRLQGKQVPTTYDFKIITKSGKEKWIKFSAGYMTQFKGMPAAIGTAIDITDIIEFQNKLHETIAQLELSEQQLKQQNEEYYALNEELTQNNQRIQKLNEELIRAKEKAEESDRLKTSFLNNISHEIRTPLNAILGFAELINNKKDLPPEKLHQYVNLIQLSGKHLLNVITNIVNVATIEAGTEKLYYKKINIKTIIEQVVNSIKPLYKNKPIDLFTEFRLDDKQAWILMDETKFSQIIINLLTNAFKFTEKGYVKLETLIEKDELIVKVKDTGVGIEESMIPYIFERFVQVDDVVKRHPMSGMGIGLSLVKSYVQLLNGDISVISKVGEGTEFTIRLPYLPVEPEDEAQSRIVSIPEDTTILLCEDIETNIQYIKEILKDYNVKLLIATNGNEAVYMAIENKVDIVLMDIKMPEKDGYTACMEIKKVKPNLPVLGLTAYANEEEINKMKSCGMSAIITKPVVPSILLNEIEKHLQIHS